MNAIYQGGGDGGYFDGNNTCKSRAKTIDSIAEDHPLLRYSAMMQDAVYSRAYAFLRD